VRQVAPYLGQANADFFGSEFSSAVTIISPSIGSGGKFGKLVIGIFTHRIMELAASPPIEIVAQKRANRL